MTDDKFLELIRTAPEWLDRPFVTTKDITQKTSISRQAVLKRLQQLYEDGKIRKHKPGRAAIWWCDD